jgi:hypothetical protein
MTVSWKKNGVMAAVLVNSLQLAVSAVFAQEGGQAPPGVAGGGQPGASAGSAGMEDEEKIFRDGVNKAEKHGGHSREYIDSLVQLGMHYNRQRRFADATKTLSKALTIIDAGTIKPTPEKDKRPEKVVETRSGNGASGTVGIHVIKTPMPYEETMAELLPQLIDAEIGTNKLKAAEVHVKRLIAVPAPNSLRHKMNLMFACNRYSEILRKENRIKEADDYQARANAINNSFTGL